MLVSDKVSAIEILDRICHVEGDLSIGTVAIPISIVRAICFTINRTYDDVTLELCNHYLCEVCIHRDFGLDIFLPELLYGTSGAWVDFGMTLA